MRKKLCLFCLLALSVFALSACGKKKVEQADADEIVMKNLQGTNWDTKEAVEKRLLDAGFVKDREGEAGMMEHYKLDSYLLDESVYVTLCYYEDDPDHLLRDCMISASDDGLEKLSDMVSSSLGVKTQKDIDSLIAALTEKDFLENASLDSAVASVEYDEDLGYQLQITPSNPDSEYVVKKKSAEESTGHPVPEAEEGTTGE